MSARDAACRAPTGWWTGCIPWGPQGEMSPVLSPRANHSRRRARAQQPPPEVVGCCPHHPSTSQPSTAGSGRVWGQCCLYGGSMEAFKHHPCDSPALSHSPRKLQWNSALGQQQGLGEPFSQAHGNFHGISVRLIITICLPSDCSHAAGQLLRSAPWGAGWAWGAGPPQRQLCQQSPRSALLYPWLPPRSARCLWGFCGHCGSLPSGNSFPGRVSWCEQHGRDAACDSSGSRGALRSWEASPTHTAPLTQPLLPLQSRAVPGLLGLLSRIFHHPGPGLGLADHGTDPRCCPKGLAKPH